MKKLENHVDDNDLVRQGKTPNERDEKAKSTPNNFSPAKYAFFYCDPPRPSLDHFNRLRNDRANFTRTDVLLSPKYKGKMNVFTSNFDEYETQLAKIDSVPIKSDESLNDETSNFSQKTVSSIDAMKFYDVSSDESNHSIYTLVSPSKTNAQAKWSQNSVLSISSDSKLELLKKPKPSLVNYSHSYQDLRTIEKQKPNEKVRYNSLPLKKFSSSKEKLNSDSLCDKPSENQNFVKKLSNNTNHQSFEKNKQIDQSNTSFDDYNDSDEKELSNFVKEINEQNMYKINNNFSDSDESEDDGDTSNKFFNHSSQQCNNHFSDDYEHDIETIDDPKSFQTTALFQSHNLHADNPHHLSNQHHKPHHYHIPSQIKNNFLYLKNMQNKTESEQTNSKTAEKDELKAQGVSNSDLMLEELKQSLSQRSIKETDRPSAARLAKRLYFLQGFKKSDISRHLSKRNSFAQLVGEEFLKHFDFSNQSFLLSLRQFLTFSIPSNPDIPCDKDQVLLHFARRFVQCNPNSEIKNEATCHALAHTLVMFDYELHYQSPLHKCTLQDFLGSLGEKAPEHNLPAELLQELFKSIQQEALEGSVDDNSEGYSKSSSQRSSLVDGPLGNPHIPCKGVNQFVMLYNDYLGRVEHIPEYKKGYVMEKSCLDSQGKKTGLGKRGWKMFYCILCSQSLLFFPNEKSTKTQSSSSQKGKGLRAKLVGMIGSKNGDNEEGESNKSTGFSPYAPPTSSSWGFILGSKKNTVKNLMGFSNSDEADEEECKSNSSKTDLRSTDTRQVNNEHNILDEQKGTAELPSHQASHHSHPLVLSLAEKALDYTKRAYVFRLSTADLSQYLIQTSDMKECQDWVDLVNTLAALYSCTQSLKNYHDILSNTSEVPCKDNEAKKSGILSVDNKSSNNTDLTDKNHTSLNTQTFEDDSIKITSHTSELPAPPANNAATPACNTTLPTSHTAPLNDGTENTKEKPQHTPEHAEINNDKTLNDVASVDWRKSLPCHPLHIKELIDRYEYLASAFEQLLQSHRSEVPEKGSKSKTIQSYCTTESLYLFYIKRFKVYSKTLQSHWLSLNQLEPSLVETIIGEVDEPTPSPRHQGGLNPFTVSKPPQGDDATNRSIVAPASNAVSQPVESINTALHPVNQNAVEKTTMEVEKAGVVYEKSDGIHEKEGVACSKVCSEIDIPTQAPLHDSIDLPPHNTAAKCLKDTTVISTQPITDATTIDFSELLDQVCNDKKPITANGSDKKLQENKHQ